uniref:Reverse transcriptase domain-containing protein n=1 Tax=Lepisosteus oculatus TaxID=7918 RepID=W5LVP3_LEPOC
LRSDFFKDPVCLTNKWIVIGGDFNSISRTRRASQLNLLLSQFGLFDCAFREAKGKVRATWRSAQGTAKHLDYVFASQGALVEKAVVQPVGFSDHAQVEIHFPHLNNQFGRGVWKLNTETLKEAEYRQYSRVLVITLMLKILTLNAVNGWEDRKKKKIRGESRAYFLVRLKREWQKGRKLQEELNSLYSQCNKGTVVSLEAISTAKAKLRGYYEQKAKKYLFRAHVEYLQAHETCSSFFFCQIWQRQSQRVLAGIQTQLGRIVPGSGEMLEAVRNYYKFLFSQKPVDELMGTTLLDNIVAQIPKKAQEHLEVPISLKELGDALLSMKLGKVPGRDGLPTEFYRRFWDVVGALLMQVTEEVFHGKIMSDSMREGILTLLEKKGDKTSLDNWRPLQLLCAHYMILARILGRRLKKVMVFLVQGNQSCGRKICWNLQLIRDTLEWVEDRKLPLMLVNLDQNKAFDRVNHAVLWETLRRMGVSEKFVTWLQTLYRKVETRVCVNGRLGRRKLVKCGVRQGCSLSPLLYIVYVEPILERIQKGPGMRGVLVPGSGGHEVKVGAYLDDITLFLSTEGSLPRELSIEKGFAKGTGSMSNKSKNTIQYYRTWRDRTEAIGGLTVMTTPARVLGVQFHKESMVKLNWEERLRKVKEKLGRWQTRSLS